MAFKEQPPRVLHVITRLDAGGSATNTIISVDRLRQHGFATSLLYGRTVDPGGAIRAGLEAVGAPFHETRRLVRNPSPVHDLLALAELEQLLGSRQFDLIHTHTSKAGILGRLAARRAGVPAVHTAHGHIFYGYFSGLVTHFFTLLERWMARHSAALISLTDDETRECLARRIGRPEQYVTIPSGVPLEDFAGIPETEGVEFRQRHGIPGGAPVFVSIGRLVPIKGFDVLLDAFARANLPGAWLVLVGGGPEEAALKARAAAAGIAGRVVFTGEMACVRCPLRAADVFVLASRNEGMGRVIVEAMAAGLPVVATRVGGIPTVLRPEEHGLLVESGDSAALAAALERLHAGGPELRRAWGAAAAAHVNPDYGVHAMVARIAAVYRRVLWQPVIPGAAGA